MKDLEVSLLPSTLPEGEAEQAPLPSSFEEAFSELESMVKRMESGGLSLEESLRAYKRGAELVTHCRKLLAAAQQDVQVLDDGVLKVLDVEDV